VHDGIASNYFPSHDASGIQRMVGLPTQSQRQTSLSFGAAAKS
jgi:hypothetical protein